MLSKIKNHGSRVFLPNGKWLEHDEETTLPTPTAKMLAMVNPNIEIIKKKTK